LSVAARDRRDLLHCLLPLILGEPRRKRGSRVDLLLGLRLLRRRREDAREIELHGLERAMRAHAAPSNAPESTHTPDEGSRRYVSSVRAAGSAIQ
jgi:hypothetical protein